MIFDEKLHVVALVATMMALGVQAASVSSNEVISAVSAWSSANGSTFARRGEATSARAVYADDGETVLYWIVRMSDGGAVIASPDSDLDLVVAVLEKFGGKFPEGHPLPSILKADMEKRLSVIGAVRASAIGGRRSSPSASASAASVSDGVRKAVAAANAQWAKYGVGGSGGFRTQALTLENGDESPYVRRIVDGFESGGRYTHWNQGHVNGKHCYNKYTPGHAVCGCVATAGSAILQFFNCTNDVGVVKGEPTYNSKPAPAQYCNTRSGVLDWSILPKSYGGSKEGSDTLDDAGIDLLGRVAFNMGVLVDMAWSDGESGAMLGSLVNAFKTYGFKAARHVTFSREKDADNENQFTKTVYAQNWCGAPVVLGIQGSSGGHAVVACGYARDPDGDQFCRVFMGWSGSADAWYKFPTVQAFSFVDEAITMIGFEDEAVIPVYGSANIPGVELELPGYVTNGVVVAAPVNANGFFGVRIPTSITDLRIGYAPRGKYAPITPFDAAALDDEETQLEGLNAAIPDEIGLSVLNTDVRYTLESGKAAAERDGKALMLVSGRSGGPRSNALMEYIYWLDETTDMSNRYVIVYNNVKAADVNRPDGDPALGIFDPNIFDPNERWTASNGRFAYENFIDPSTDILETGEIVYTFSESNTVAITNTVLPAMEKGYDSYLRNVSGIKVTVKGVEILADGVRSCEFGDVTCGYGVTANSWTNGEYAVFSAPAAVTNRSEGVVMSCIGWTTNEVVSAESLTNIADGAEAEIRLFSGDEVTLTWVWEASHYLVKASADNSGAAFASAVTPAESWVEAGAVATIKAEGQVGSYAFSEWNVGGKSGEYAEDMDTAYYNENNTAVSFTVDEPITVSAVYRNGGETPADPVEYSFALSASPSDLQGELPPPSGFVWGENTGYSPAVVLGCASSCTDSTGGVWVCKGWLVNGALVAGTRIMADAGGEIVSVWEPKADEAVDLGEISITALAAEGDGTWTITVSGGKKGGWYWLYSTDDLSKFAGDEATWTAALPPAAVAEGTNPKQASEDGEITFRVSSGDGSLFWRARATHKETGD